MLLLLFDDFQSKYIWPYQHREQDDSLKALKPMCPAISNTNIALFAACLGVLSSGYKVIFAVVK